MGASHSIISRASSHTPGKNKEALGANESSRLKALRDNKHNTTTPFRFLDLPPEIRNMIYDELVVVGKIFYTPSDHDLAMGRRHENHQRFRKPDLSIMRVCKQLHSESESRYLSKNLFVLPFDWWRRPPFYFSKGCGGDDYDEPHAAERYLFSPTGMRLVKNISLSYDQKQMARKSLPCSHHGWRKDYAGGQISFFNLPQQNRTTYMHDMNVSWLGEDWARILDRLFDTGIQFNYVELDFTNAHCPSGCCRLVDTIRTEWILIQTPNTVDITGLLPGEEQHFTFIGEDGVHYTRKVLKERYGLRFRKSGETTKWDSWMTN